MPLMLNKSNLQGTMVSSAAYYPWTNAMLVATSDTPSKGYGDAPSKTAHSYQPSATDSARLPAAGPSTRAPGGSPTQQPQAQAPSAGDRVVGLLAAGASSLVSQYAPAGTAAVVTPLINTASALLQEAL